MSFISLPLKQRWHRAPTCDPEEGPGKVDQSPGAQGSWITMENLKHLALQEVGSLETSRVKGQDFG